LGKGAITERNQTRGRKETGSLDYKKKEKRTHLNPISSTKNSGKRNQRPGKKGEGGKVRRRVLVTAMGGGKRVDKPIACILKSVMDLNTTTYEE